MWMLARSCCATATGLLPPAAWCETPAVTGSSQRFRIAEPGGLDRRVRAVWQGAATCAITNKVSNYSCRN